MVQFYSPKAKHNKPYHSMVTINIESLDAFGQGVGRHDGKTVFVNDALPGETVEAKIVEDKRQYAKAKLVKRLNDSDQRIKPRCPHFYRCGGCQQQHAAIELQRRSKQDALLRLVQRQTGAVLSESTIISGQPYHYRRRVRLGLQFDPKHGRLMMGFRQTATNELVEIECCPIMETVLEQLIQPLRQCLSSLQAVKKLGHVELVATESGVTVVLRHLSPISETDCHKLKDFAQRFDLSFYLAAGDHSLTLLCGNSPYYMLEGLKLAFNPQGFIQINREINQKMIEKALEWLDISSGDRLLDLFCGVGNFTLPMAKKAAEVVAVEGVNSLVELGRANAEFNQMKNIHFYHENLEADLSRQIWADKRFNKVLLDPARAGALEVMSEIVKLAPQTIVYVSCNPATLARDCNVLLPAGYKLKEICMIDMFPHTGHLESMVLLTK
jgi:23S rRNA (uracil1939-C5)-methyltransferase